MDKQALLRKIPKIDELINSEELQSKCDEIPSWIVLESIRETIDELRSFILEGTESVLESFKFDEFSIIEKAIVKIREKQQNNVRRIINATGTILHTNLGRANLSERAGFHVQETASAYSTLEYNVKEGKRGSRHDLVSGLVAKITGAEDAMVVNNNAAAVLLCLSALAKDKNVVVSRGELVEIGGSFRIPEIMELSGSNLIEVGTTNKTHLRDYRKAALDREVALMLKVHTSNYKIVGFTQEVEIEELVELGKELEIPIIYDLGSGLLCNLEPYGIHEPTVQETVASGADLVLFSGDKLLGGPQAGIIAGKKEMIAAMKAHQLARVIRVDKMTLAALESTLRTYLDMETAKAEIPILSMITMTPATTKENAEKLVERLEEIGGDFQFEIIPGESQIGGGSTPNQFIKGFVIACISNSITPDNLEKNLRFNDIPIIGRISNDRYIIDPRTLFNSDYDSIVNAFKKIWNDINGK
ncbi:MAG: L-seryl-tRNA(Sec) selenium transferase [Tissierellia bacterium]|nr:L-seryl-tRNA(Sec) selenium transferase [Tissierellia bacterium]